jgi:hypothetical protein
VARGWTGGIEAGWRITLLHKVFQSRKWVVEILRHDQVRQLELIVREAELAGPVFDVLQRVSVSCEVASV